VDDDHNWGFEDWSLLPPPGFALVPPEQVTVAPADGTSAVGQCAATLAWSTSDNRDLVATAYLRATSGTTYTAHWWIYDTDPLGRARPWLGFFAPDLSETSRHYAGVYSKDAMEWLEYTDQAAAPATGVTWVRSGLRMYDVTASGAGTLSVDAFDLTQPVVFNPTDGVLDSAAVPEVTLPDGLQIRAALNDQGTLYLSIPLLDPPSDQLVALWLGAPDGTSAISVPTATPTVLPSPAAQRLVLLLDYQASLGSCSWSALSTALAPMGLGNANCASGSVLEAAVDLVATQGVTRPAELVSALALWAGSPGSQVVATDVALWHRANLLVGRVAGAW
jgi:hypothetical protein